MCKCKCKTLPDRIEDLIEQAICDQDWLTTEFLQDVLEVVLAHRNDVAEAALKLVTAESCCPKELGCPSAS